MQMCSISQLGELYNLSLNLFANHNLTVQTLQRRRGNVLMTVINRSWLVLLQQQQQLGHQNVTCVMVGTFTSYNAILSSFLTCYSLFGKFYKEN